MSFASTFFGTLLPTALVAVGTELQSRDTNKTGADDAVGTILIAAAPAVSVALSPNPNTKALVKALTAIRDAAQSGLDSLGA